MNLYEIVFQESIGGIPHKSYVYAFKADMESALKDAMALPFSNQDVSHGIYSIREMVPAHFVGNLIFSAEGGVRLQIKESR